MPYDATPSAASTAATARIVLSERRIVTSPRSRHHDRRCRRQVRPHGTLEIGYGLFEVAQRGEIVQLGIEQYAPVVDQGLKIYAIRLLDHAQDGQRGL